MTRIKRSVQKRNPKKQNGTSNIECRKKGGRKVAGGGTTFFLTRKFLSLLCLIPFSLSVPRINRGLVRAQVFSMVGGANARGNATRSMYCTEYNDVTIVPLSGGLGHAEMRGIKSG